jgi:hypothetical protein
MERSLLRRVVSVVLCIGIWMTVFTVIVGVYVHFACPYTSFRSTCVNYEIAVLDAGSEFLLKLMKLYNIALMKFYHLLHCSAIAIIGVYESTSPFEVARAHALK